MSDTKIPPGYVMDSAGNLRQIKTYENVWDAIFTETELAREMQKYMELLSALRALVERWRVKAKYYKNQDWWAEAGRVDDCADELEAIYKEVEK